MAINLALRRRALFNSIRQMLFFEKNKMSVNKQNFIREWRRVWFLFKPAQVVMSMVIMLNENHCCLLLLFTFVFYLWKQGNIYINQEKIKDYIKFCRNIYLPVIRLFVKYEIELSAEKNYRFSIFFKVGNRQVLA